MQCYKCNTIYGYGRCPTCAANETAEIAAGWQKAQFIQQTINAAEQRAHEASMLEQAAEQSRLEQERIELEQERVKELKRQTKEMREQTRIIKENAISLQEAEQKGFDTFVLTTNFLKDGVISFIRPEQPYVTQRLQDAFVRGFQKRIDDYCAMYDCYSTAFDLITNNARSIREDIIESLTKSNSNYDHSYEFLDTVFENDGVTLEYNTIYYNCKFKLNKQGVFVSTQNDLETTHEVLQKWFFDEFKLEDILSKVNTEELVTARHAGIKLKERKKEQNRLLANIKLEKKKIENEIEDLNKLRQQEETLLTQANNTNADADKNNTICKVSRSGTAVFFILTILFGGVLGIFFASIMLCCAWEWYDHPKIIASLPIEPHQKRIAELEFKKCKAQDVLKDLTAQEENAKAQAV